MIDAIDGSVAASGTTGADGTITFPSLREGYYTVNVTDADHNSYSGVVLVSAGQTQTVTAFLPRNLVTYTWSVVPTQVADETQITLQTTFETNVPVPVVTVDPGYIDASTLDFSKGYAQINYTITNHGLIAAQDVVLNLPQGGPPDLVFTALVTKIGTLPPLSSVTIPVIVQSLVPISLGTPDALGSPLDPATVTSPIIPSVPLGVVASTPTTPATGQVSPLSSDVNVNPQSLGPVTQGDCPSTGVPELNGSKQSDDVLQNEYALALAAAPFVAARYGLEATSVYATFLAGGPNNPILKRTTPPTTAMFGDGSDVVNRAGSNGQYLGYKKTQDTVAATNSVLSFARDVINQELQAGDLNSCSLPSQISLSDLVDYADNHGMQWDINGFTANGTQYVNLIECNYNPGGVQSVGGLLSGGIGSSKFLNSLDSRAITGDIKLTPPTSSIDHRLKLEAQLHFTVKDSFDFNPYGFPDSLGSILGELVTQLRDKNGKPLGPATGLAAYVLAAVLSDLEYNGWAQAVPVQVDFDYTSKPSFINICTYQIRDGCVQTCPTIQTNVAYDYFCGNQINRNVPSIIQSNMCCKPQLPGSQSSNSHGTISYGPASGAGGGGGACSSPTVTTASTDVAAPGGGTVSNAASSVCAKVVLQLSQSLVQTHQAFAATLQLADNEPTDVTGVKIDLLVKDASGTYSNALFGVGSPTLSGLTAVDGTGDVAADSTGTATWTLIPSLQASGATPTQYTVGGTLQYVDQGVPVSITLADVPITVYPQPELHLDYFLQRDVIGDDPFTPQVEPSVPYELDVLVQNVGAGAAQNLTIASAQPKIVDNAKGLAINFNIIGTQVNGQSLSPSLTANIGTVAPGATALARWLMTSSLQGLFTDYSATFEHQGPGGQQLSLVDSVNFHVLIHAGQDFGGGDTPGPAFLVNDTSDGTDTPNKLYFANDTSVPVTVASNPTFDGAPNPSNQLQIHLTVPAGSGWEYINALDPGGSGYELVSVIHSDGTILPTQDFWQTTRTFIGNGLPPLDENRVHILDHNGTGSYTLVYAPADQAPPTIVSISPPPPSPAAVPVDGLTVTFSKPIDPTTFDFHALTLTRNGGPNLITSGVTIAQLTPTTYQIHGLAALDASDGAYTLAVNTGGIADPSGILGTGSATQTWTMAAVSPAVASVTGVTSGLRNTPVGAVLVAFSKAIDPTSFGPGALSLTQNGGPNLITSTNVTISNVSGNTYEIGGLGLLAASDGSYTFTIDATQVHDPSGDPGVGAVTVSWTMDTQAPAITQIAPAEPTPRNFPVPAIDVTFSKPIDPTTLNPSSLSLTQNGGPNLITSTNITISNVSGNTYEIGGLDALTSGDGPYTFVVNLAAVKDLAGNAGQGSGSVSFVVDTQAPAAPSNLAIRTASGGARPSGVVNSTAVTLTGSLAEPGLTVHAVDATSGIDLGDAVVSGTTFSLPIQFTGPGNHHLVVNAIDAAGNVSSDATFDVFVDLTPLTVTGFSTVASPRTSPVSSVDLTFGKAIDPSTLTPSDFTLTREGGPNRITGSNIAIIGISDTTYRITGLDALAASDGAYTLTLLPGLVADSAGDVSGSASVSWLIDSQAPTSQVSPLPKVETLANFPVTATGTDPIPSGGGTSSGIQSYALYVSDNGAPFTYWTTVPAANPTANYAGQGGHMYAFYSVATDAAGNVETRAPGVDASTYLPDLTTPSTQVTSVDTTNPQFVVSWSGIDTGGSGLASFTLFVSVDSESGHRGRRLPGRPAGRVGHLDGIDDLSGDHRRGRAHLQLLHDRHRPRRQCRRCPDQCDSHRAHGRLVPGSRGAGRGRSDRPGRPGRTVVRPHPRRPVQ